MHSIKFVEFSRSFSTASHRNVGGAGVWYGVSMTSSFSDGAGDAGHDVLVGGVYVEGAKVEPDSADHQCTVE